MAHVILLALKIIGIVLLVILGIALLVLLTVLLVPVRYRIEGRKNGGIRAQAKVTWLLHLVSVPVVYQDGKLDVRLKLFGITVKRFLESAPELEEELEDAAGETVKETAKALNREAERLEETENRRAGADAGEEAGREEAEEKEAEQKETEPGMTDRREARESTARGDPEAGSPSAKETGAEEEKGAPQGKKKKFSPGQIVSGFREKIKKLKYTFLGICDKIKEGVRKAGAVRDFLMLESTRAALAGVKKQLLYLLKKILPRHVKGWLRFGFADPSVTGQLLGAISVFYGLVPWKLELRPDFENKVIEGEATIKGRLRLITVVIIALRLLLDKNFRVFLKRLKNGF